MLLEWVNWKERRKILPLFTKRKSTPPCTTSRSASLLSAHGGSVFCSLKRRKTELWLQSAGRGSSLMKCCPLFSGELRKLGKKETQIFPKQSDYNKILQRLKYSGWFCAILFKSLDLWLKSWSSGRHQDWGGEFQPIPRIFSVLKSSENCVLPTIFGISIFRY